MAVWDDLFTAEDLAGYTKGAGDTSRRSARGPASPSWT